MVIEKHGFIAALSVSTTASTTSSAKDDFVLLAYLQGILIHAPPGLRPLRTEACAPTKIQIIAKQKAEKEAKAKTAKDEKLLAASRKIEMKTKQQTKLISSAKSA